MNDHGPHACRIFVRRWDALQAGGVIAGIAGVVELPGCDFNHNGMEEAANGASSGGADGEVVLIVELSRVYEQPIRVGAIHIKSQGSALGAEPPKRGHDSEDDTPRA